MWMTSSNRKPNYPSRINSTYRISYEYLKRNKKKSTITSLNIAGKYAIQQYLILIISQKIILRQEHVYKLNGCLPIFCGHTEWLNAAKSVDLY